MVKKQFCEKFVCMKHDGWYIRDLEVAFVGHGKHQHLNKTTDTLSRQQFTKAVLSNILNFFYITKKSRLGIGIVSRNFIMCADFHPMVLETWGSHTEQLRGNSFHIPHFTFMME